MILRAFNRLPAATAALCLLLAPAMVTEDEDKNVGGVCFKDGVPWNFDGTGTDGTYDMVSVAIHELGHALGLAHSPDPNSVMYFEFDGKPKRQLTAEDRALIRLLYP